MIEDFEIAMDEASIYLSEEQYAAVLDFFDTLGNGFIETLLPSCDFLRYQFRIGPQDSGRRVALPNINVEGFQQSLGKVNNSINGWAFEPVGVRGGDLYKEHHKSLISGSAFAPGTVRTYGDVDDRALKSPGYPSAKSYSPSPDTV